MPCITTNHRFIIDDKHPADVFDEMENFFSLYTVAIDDLQQVSVRLSVPPSFDITANKKIAQGYRQFTQSLKYTIPDIHILPIKTLENDSQSAEEDDSNDDDNTVILLIQRLDGYDIEAEEKPSFYQHILDKIKPKFTQTQSDDGLYPTRQNQSLPEPTPIAVPVPIAVPAPTPTPQSQYQPPIQSPSQPQNQPQPSYQQPPVQPTYQQPIPKPILPTPQPAPQIQTRSTPERLPNITKSAKPYQDLLTQMIVAEAQKQKALLNGQIIHQITLKSSDSLTTAMIEQLFHSFNHAHEANAPHDAIDLVSYGYEVLKPKLSAIGVNLADDAQFGLKTNANATPADIARLQSGGVFSNEINLRIKLLTSTTAQPTTMANSSPSPTAVPSVNSFANHPNLNKNPQRIALMLKVSDPLGERQQKVSEFPVNFVSNDFSSNAHNIRLFGVGQGQFGSMIELDGQVLIDGISPTVNLTRNGQRLNNGDVLMPNDVLSINGGQASITLGLV